MCRHRWHPDPNKAKCLSVTCQAPTQAQLSIMKAEQMAPKRSLVPHKEKLTLRCLPGRETLPNILTVYFFAKLFVI